MNIRSGVLYGLWLAATLAGIVYLKATGTLGGFNTVVGNPGFLLLVASVLLIPWIVNRAMSRVSVPVGRVLLGVALSAAFILLWMYFADGRTVAWSVWLAVATAPFWILLTTRGSYSHKFSGWFAMHDEAIVARARELGLEGIGRRFSEPFVGVGFKLKDAPFWQAADGMEDFAPSPDWRWTDEIPEAVALLTLSEEFPQTDIVYIEGEEALGRRRSTRFFGTVFHNGEMSHKYIEGSLQELLPYLRLDSRDPSDFALILSSYTWGRDDPQAI